MKKVSKTMLYVMAAGDDPVNYETPAGKMQFRKPAEAKDMIGMEVGSHATKIKVPDICASLQKHGQKCNESCGMVVRLIILAQLKSELCVSFSRKAFLLHMKHFFSLISNLHQPVFLFE